MKKQLKKSTKKFLILFSIIFLISCEKDLYEDVIQNTNQKVSIKNIYKTDIEKEVKLERYLNKVEQLNSKSLNRSIHDVENSITIITDYAKKVTNNETGKHTFNFTIEVTNGDNQNLQNLVLVSNNEDSYDAYLVKYGFSTIQNSTIAKTKTQIIPINLDLGLFSTNELSKIVFECSETWSYIENEHDGNEVHGLNADGTCAVASCSYGPEWYVSAINCGYFDDGISTPGDGISTPGGSGRGGPSGSTPGGTGGLNGTSGGTTSPTIVEVDPTIIISPVMTPPLKSFIKGLSAHQQTWWYNTNNNTSVNACVNYLNSNLYSDESVGFVKELIDLEINGYLLSFFPSFKYPINSNYSTLYPNFTILVKEYIPLLKNDQRLLNTINRLTGVSISTIKNDLTWGNGPEINITQLGLDPSGNPYYGKFNILEPNKIYIDIDLVQQIEALSNIPNPTPQQNQQIGFLNALITFSVCLHEYVHYSDFAFDGTMQDNENLELGLLFEEIYLGGYYEFNPNGNVIFIKAN